MSIPSTLIAGFIRLASCGYMGARIVHSLWLIEADPHRGGSISLMPWHVLARLGAGHAGSGHGGQRLTQPLCLILLAEAVGHTGQVEEGLRLLWIDTMFVR